MSPEPRDHSFDELTRGLASGTLSRGKALRLMGAALVGGALASIPSIAWAKPKPAGAKCNHNHQCESGNCSSSGTCAAAACGSVGEACLVDDDCCSGECVVDRFGGGLVCAAPPPPPPICTPSCPANCSCFFAPDGTTTICTGCNPACSAHNEVSCEGCTTGLEVCVAGPPGFVTCVPACTATV
jgi:hypothetical protein